MSDCGVCAACFVLRHWPCCPHINPWCCGCQHRPRIDQTYPPEVLFFGDSSLDFFANRRSLYCLACPAYNAPFEYTDLKGRLGTENVFTMAQAGAPAYELCCLSYCFLRNKAIMPTRAMVVSMGGNKKKGTPFGSRSAQVSPSDGRFVLQCPRC